MELVRVGSNINEAHSIAVPVKNRLFPTIVILLDRGDFAYWWSCIGKGLRLQPFQQACLNIHSNCSNPNKTSGKTILHQPELAVKVQVIKLDRVGPIDNRPSTD